MSKMIPSQDENHLDNISASRYIVKMKQSINGSRKLSPKAFPSYVSETGILLRADCLDLLANIREHTIDLAFADPPFNLGKEYDHQAFVDEWETEAYRNWCRAWLLELIRVLKPGGALYIYHLPKMCMELGTWLNSIPTIEYKAWIALNMKSGFPIRGRIHPAHYGLLYYTKRGAKPTFNVVRRKSPTCRHCGKLIKDYGGYRKKFERFEDEAGVPWTQISDFWDDTRPARQDKARVNQVNELPLHIPERAVLMSSNPKDVVLDCFAGGGSTLHAAQLHNRFWIGGEIGEPVAALKRIATFIGKDESPQPTERLLGCLSQDLAHAVTNISDEPHARPINNVGVIDEVTNSMEKYASKSRVLGF